MKKLLIEFTYLTRAFNTCTTLTQNISFQAYFYNVLVGIPENAFALREECIGIKNNFFKYL